MISTKGGLSLSAYTGRGSAVQRNGLFTFWGWLGACGIGVFSRVGQCFAAVGRGTVQFFRDLAHGIGRVLRLVRDLLVRPIRLRGDVARRAEQEWKNAAGTKGLKRFQSVCRMLIAVFLSENGIFASVFRYAVPLLCCAFLYSVVRYGTSLEYNIAVTFNGTPLGVIAEENDYNAAVEIVRKRLSYTEDDYEIRFQRDLKLMRSDPDTPVLTAGELADRMLQDAEIDLTEGWGVYLNDEFLGAVADTSPIQSALTEQLNDYYDLLDGTAEDLHYVDTVTYEKGTYLSENLKDASEIARLLTGVTEGTKEYSALAEDTIYSVALRFSTTAERLRELNPDLPEILHFGKKVTVPTLKHYMPMTFTKTTNVHTFVDYDTIRTETNRLPVGKERVAVRGVKGERRNTMLCTYKDGEETGRSLLKTEILSLPQDEEISVGTYEAKPASTLTKLAGTGQFAWPLNGGYISDVFISNRNHRGIDLAAPLGTEIYAAEDGVVTVATIQSSYGNYVKLDHQNGFETLYAHCSALLVVPGQEVTRGQIIALVGSTGHSTGPHLHFEVRINGMNYNPADFLRVNVD